MSLTPLTAMEAVESLLSPDHRERFRTGWSIDDRCGCVGAGETALVWARSGAGKSTWTQNVIANTPDIPTLVVNMEMTPRRQVDWLAAMTADLPVAGREVEELLGYSEDPRYSLLVEALRRLPEQFPNLHFAQPSLPTPEDIRYMLDDVESASGKRPHRVFIDHIGLMADCQDYTGYLRTGARLHALAMDEGVAIYILQQVGRSGGEQGRNDGHLPITLSSGVYTGEQDADWVFGLYRPDRNPKFKKSRFEMSSMDWLELQNELDQVRNMQVLQVVKNRPFGDLCDDGITLQYDTYTRRLRENGEVS